MDPKNTTSQKMFEEGEEEVEFNSEAILSNELDQPETKIELSVEERVANNLRKRFPTKPTMKGAKKIYPHSSTFKNDAYFLVFKFDDKNVYDKITLNELKANKDFLDKHFKFNDVAYENSVILRQNKNKKEFFYFNFFEYRNTLADTIAARIREGHLTPWNSIKPSAILNSK